MRCPLAPLAILLAAQALGAAPPNQDHLIDSDLERLTAQLRENRKRNLEYLYRYAVEGRFPQNEDYPGKAVPYFKDRHANVCAIAHLMIRSGLGGVVDRVSRTNNHVRIRDVAEGPVLEWMLLSGFTQEECALIQPCYPGKKVYVFIDNERISVAAGRIRVNGYHITPREYVFRPHLSKVNLIRSHLFYVYECLVLESERSIGLAVGRLASRRNKDLRALKSIIREQAILDVGPLFSRPRDPSPMIRAYPNMYSVEIEYVGAECNCMRDPTERTWKWTEWERQVYEDTPEELSIMRPVRSRPLPNFDPGKGPPRPPRIRLRFR